MPSAPSIANAYLKSLILHVADRGFLPFGLRFAPWNPPIVICVIRLKTLFLKEKTPHFPKE